MSDYTRTFTGDTFDASNTVIAGTTLQTEFALIRTALATKQERRFYRDPFTGLLISETMVPKDESFAYDFGNGNVVTDLGTFTITAADLEVDIDAALGNVFLLTFTCDSNGDSLLLQNPTNAIDGQLITLICRRGAGSTPDVLIVPDSEYLSDFTNGNTTSASTAAVYNMLRVGSTTYLWTVDINVPYA